MFNATFPLWSLSITWAKLSRNVQCYDASNLAKRPLNNIMKCENGCTKLFLFFFESKEGTLKLLQLQFLADCSDSFVLTFFLCVVDISKNRFTDIPKEICEFVLLEKLNCYNNSIRSLPQNITRLQYLSYLDIR